MNISEKLTYLDQLYPDGTPEYVLSAGKTYIVFKIQSLFGNTERLKVTISDVVDFYVRQEVATGIAFLAGAPGDWHNMLELANQAKAWFELVNPQELEKQEKEAGVS